MIRNILFILPLLLAFLTLSGQSTPDGIPPGFEALFDGKTLANWETPDPSYWSIEEGAITAKITEAHPCSVNQYLVYEKEPLDDFELRLKFRMNGWPTKKLPSINGGFQFRSKIIEGHDVAGYQVDNDLGPDWLVRLYDEHGRHTLALRGQRTTINAAGEMTHEDIAEAQGPADFRLQEWHEYRLLCKGPKLTLYVNDKLMAEVTDNDPEQQDFSGILALQLHSGPPMTVQFKDIWLKKL